MILSDKVSHIETNERVIRSGDNKIPDISILSTKFTDLEERVKILENKELKQWF